jgi:hypothetical protein
MGIARSFDLRQRELLSVAAFCVPRMTVLAVRVVEVVDWNHII